MGVITAIKPTRRDPNRASIHVDGKSAATLPLSMIEAMNLQVGTVWTAELERRVTRSAAEDKAYRQAMQRLNRRQYTARDLRQKLRRLEHDDATIDRVLQRLRELRLIDDERYGETLLREMQRSKPAGPKLMRAKLYQKGVDAKVIDRLVDEATDSDSQRDGALAFAEKKLRSLQRVDAVTRRRRLYGALARRGFDGDVISDVMEQLRDRLSDADDE